MAAEVADVVVVGSINVDLMVRVARRPAPGETVLGTSLRVAPGGKGANQAVAAARAGARVAMVGAVGDDEYHDTGLRELKSAGVDLDGVATVSDSTGIAVITVGSDADNSIIVIAGANASVDGARVAAAAELIGAAKIVILQLEIPFEADYQAAKLCQGRLIVNLAPVASVDPELLLQADPLVVNEHEAAAALGILQRRSADVAPLPEGGETECIQQLLAAGVPSVVLTVGSRGSFVAPGPDAGIWQLAAARVSAVDTTGAGDGFVGALAARLAEGESLVEAARFATGVSGYSVQYPGAQPSYPQAGETLPQIPDPIRVA